MADFRIDQAAGLRRLFGGSGLQVVTFVAGCEGVGRSAAIVNIAAALARFGKEVLVIDENAGLDDVAESFGMIARFDLLDVIQRDIPVQQTILRPIQGLSILPAARMVGRLGGLHVTEQQRLLRAMSTLENSTDIILVDASISHPLGFSPFGLISRETVVMLSATTSAITEAYALIKKVSQAFSRRHFRILVNKVRTQEEGRSIFDNIAKVASQRSVAALDYAGAIPLDAAVVEASALCRPVVLHAQEAPASLAYRDVATDMQYWPTDNTSGGVEQVLQQLLHLSQRYRPEPARV